MNRTQRADLTRVINRIETLPTLPIILSRVMELIRNPKTSAADIGKIVSKDQALTTRLLRLVNSAFYGFPRRVSTMTHAITIIGFNALKNLLLATSVFDLLPGQSREGGFDLNKFWEHSIGCAIGAKVMAKYIRYEESEELFVAGLLHDIGKIVENQFLHEEFVRVIELVQQENSLIVNAERELLGYTHALFGKLLAERWGLPVKLVESIAFHHQPELTENFPKEAAVVHLADILCRAQGMGSGGDNKIPPLSKSAWEKLGLDLSTIEPIMEEMQPEFENAISILR